MALGRIRRRSRNTMLPRIQITSLMDMFTMILIFLLFSFSEKVETIHLQKDINLPKSNAQTDYSDSIQLILSQSTLRLGEDVVGTVSGDQVVGLDPERLKQSYLYQRLKECHDRLADERAQEGGQESSKMNHLIFLCDKQHSFKTINPIIKTAGLAGFPNFQFAVLKE
jgi:biopolymer transport protein ExbD